MTELEYLAIGYVFFILLIAIEAGVTNLWWKYVGTAGHVIGIDRFGLSAPGNVVMQELGITADKVVEAVENL